jgi:hypothetical protein
MALHECCMRSDGCISNGALDDELGRRAEGPPCSDENALIMASGVGLAALALPSGLGVARIPIWRRKGCPADGNRHRLCSCAAAGRACGCRGRWECLGRRQARTGAECGLRRTVRRGWRRGCGLPRSPGRWRRSATKPESYLLLLARRPHHAPTSALQIPPCPTPAMTGLTLLILPPRRGS